MSIKKKIMIIEDQALLNNMMQKVLSNDYDIVCTCTSAKEMMNLYKIHTPDLILTDVVTKDGANGIYYGKEVKEKYEKAPVHAKVKYQFIMLKLIKSLKEEAAASFWIEHRDNLI